MNADEQATLRRWTIVVGLVLGVTVSILFPLLVTKWDRHLVEVSLGPFRWVGLVPISLGVILVVWSAALLFTRGGGTPAPWDPPQRFILAGPYQYVRNPMMLGVFATVFGEAVLAESLAILLYLGLVVSVVCWYVVAIEEKGLEIRFTDTYVVYKERVPRWLPHLRRKR
ncbi:MAG: methyltransferase [candidate division NC10 bacterium]|nr:methyltransferase [candidate division NC10 bacterium]